LLSLLFFYEKDLIKKFKIMAIEQDKRQHDLLEEAIQDILDKYKQQKKKPKK
jgi:hypothetical protein